MFQDLFSWLKDLFYYHTQRVNPYQTPKYTEENLCLFCDLPLKEERIEGIPSTMICLHCLRMNGKL